MPAAGVVVAFDTDAGVGTVRIDEGGEQYFFHCTAIADGSRVIEVGTPVSVDIVAGHQGRYEATSLTPR